MAKKTKQSNRTGMLDQATMDFLDLSQQPFTAAILSPDAIFTHTALTQLRDTIKHHLQFSDLLLVAEGDYGSGKTTLFRQMMQEEISNVFLMPLQAEATDTLAQIQQKMAIHLKEHGEANSLDDNLKNLQMFDQTPVLMIDDAHVLSDTTLQELVRYRQQLFAEQQLQMKILLFANRGMAGTLEQVTDIQHSQMFVQELPALDTRQIPTFIAHRLAAAGAARPPVLDERSVQDIYRKSAGNPMRVMTAGAETLENLGRKSTRRGLSLSLPGRATGLFIGLSLAALAGIGGYFYLAEPQPAQEALQESPMRAAPGQSAPEQSARVPTQSIPEQPAPAVADPTRAGDPGDTGAATEGNMGTASTPGKDMPATAPAPTETPGGLPGSLPAPPSSDSGDEPQAVATEAPADRPASPAVESRAMESPATAAREGRKPEDTASVKVAPAPPARPAPEPAPMARQPQQPELEKLAQMGLKDARWLLRQNPRHWTLQILGAREPETLVNFASRHRLGAETAWYETDLEGRPWYVLVHRTYTDRDVARQSVQRLPAALQQNRPWVKSLASVQQSIRQ